MFGAASLPYSFVGHTNPLSPYMAVPKEKVITVLNAKLSGKNVSQKLKDSYANRWAEKIATEEDIDAYVDDRFEDVTDAQKEADRRATEASTKARADAAKAAAGDDGGTQTDSTQQPPIPDGTPDWYKPILAAQQKQMETLTAALSGMQQAKTAETIADRFKNHEKVKPIADKLPATLKGYTPASEAEFEAAVAEYTTAFTPVLAQMKTAGFGHDTPGNNGKTPGGDGAPKPASPEDVKAVMAQL